MINLITRGDARPKRSLKSMMIFTLSLLLGAGGVYYSRQYIEGQVSHYKRQLEKTEPMVEVVVPVRSMVRGEVLIADDLSVRQIPEQYSDSNTVNSSNFELALGQRIGFDIDEGRPLLWAHLEGGLSPTFSGKVEDGLRAMTIRVDEINSISGFLQPKDKVDLLLSYGSGSKQKIIPLIERLNVIATGVQTFVDNSAAGLTRSFSTITVHVTPEDGQRITLAQQIGKLTAMLRNPEDESSLNSVSMTVSQLLNEDALPELSAPEDKTRRKSVFEPPRIEYIIGGR